VRPRFVRNGSQDPRLVVLAEFLAQHAGDLAQRAPGVGGGDEALEQVGAVAAGCAHGVERGFPQREIAESAYRFQQAVERKEKTVVGVNDFVQDDEVRIPTLYIDESTGDRQVARLKELRQTRDNEKVRAALAGLQQAARGTANIMDPILDASRAYATLGEMCDALREVWGEYEEPPVF